MSPNEIVGLLAIFTEPIKSEAVDSIVRKSEGTIEINLRLESIENLIQGYKKNEEEIFGNNFVDWSLSYSYVDIALLWTNGISTQDMILVLQNYGEYEGQFVKNMTRVYNIINDIVCICKMTGQIDMLPNLTNASNLVIRDIVNANSLYLS